MKKNIALATLLGLALPGISFAQENPGTQKQEVNIQPAVMDKVKTMAEELIKRGFTAGDGYGEVWIRDLNTFIELSCKVNDKSQIRKHLITFFQFQQPDGAILDGYIPTSKATIYGKFYKSELTDEYLGHKNTVETDQETSLVQAVAKYIRSTGDKSILTDKVAGLTVKNQMGRALDFLLKNRFDEKHGLLWGATTVDWGDVQPEHSWGVVIDENTHRAIDIYDNAMFLIAIKDFIAIADLNASEAGKWKKVYNNIRQNINKYLWDEKAQQYIPHIYLNGSPFPASFDESKIYYHGGTAVAIEAGLLTKKQVKEAYQRMQKNVADAHAATIGLTIYPVYPLGTFENKGMGPYSYQNGGDWTWFGGRMVSQLIRYNLLAEAKEALTPMLDRVVKNNGFYEWYTPDNKPMGSSSFRGEAGVLWTAITELEKKK
ncbi:GH36-type glycosyl hydrolase domain-containing protein [Pedobacter sp. UBA5917]|uniref:GH36-type glycosyl hydrolase domain-containing protein n=1 Tax=Pedobacter sp. UBA5917 TaxID=1947061 RepID=UPI0025E2BDE2|nr:amylo-alpha-1,6-glucosidase [Pedobacter sp. UBA5917]